jgi:predicted TIM-barrel fold metal-dependent hydrolase
MRELIKQCESFSTLKNEFDRILRLRLNEGFIGVKSHLFELRAQPIRTISDAEAEACYAKARQGDRPGFEDVYLNIFQHVLVLTQELGFSVHVHTDCTGNPNDLQTCTDPYAIAPLMRDERFADARIVFLHGNPPDFGHAAWLTHSYPNVWVDIGWSLPWLGLNIEQVIEEILSVAPHSKVMLGSGQHNHAEMVWAASKIAKAALANVLERKVNVGLLSKAQAIETAEQLLYKNAFRLYGIKA